MVTIRQLMIFILIYQTDYAILLPAMTHLDYRRFLYTAETAFRTVEHTGSVFVGIVIAAGLLRL